MRARAFSLLEMMVVIAIVGLLAALAVPSFQDLAAHYRAMEGFRSALAAVTQARALAQRTNAPVRMQVFANRVELETAVVVGGAESTRKSVTGYTPAGTVHLAPEAAFTEVRVLASDGSVASKAAAGTAEAAIIFCSSTDAYYRDAATLAPVCGVGNLANVEAKILVSVLGETQHVRVRQVLGSVELHGGT